MSEPIVPNQGESMAQAIERTAPQRIAAQREQLQKLSGSKVDPNASRIGGLPLTARTDTIQPGDIAHKPAEQTRAADGTFTAAPVVFATPAPVKQAGETYTAFEARVAEHKALLANTQGTPEQRAAEARAELERQGINVPTSAAPDGQSISRDRNGNLRALPPELQATKDALTKAYMAKAVTLEGAARHDLQALYEAQLADVLAGRAPQRYAKNAEGKMVSVGVTATPAAAAPVAAAPVAAPDGVPEGFIEAPATLHGYSLALVKEAGMTHMEPGTADLLATARSMGLTQEQVDTFIRADLAKK